MQNSEDKTEIEIHEETTVSIDEVFSFSPLLDTIV